MNSLALPRVLSLPQSDVLAQRALVALVALTVTGVVVYYGWISDDAYVTARYAYNLVHGYGPVFNPGERVQGYTHPLWFLLFSAGLAMLREPILVSVLLGATLTLLTMMLVARTVTRADLPPLTAAALYAAFAALLALSESWRSFQTGGLENSLTNFLLALLIVDLWRKPGQEIPLARGALYSGLLVLTRPDFAVLVAPLDVLLLMAAWRRREMRRIVLGSLPLAAWLAFAHLYYGTIVPNTVTDKIGIFTLEQGVRHGTYYLFDFARNEPATAMAIVVLGAFVARSRLSVPLKLVLAGAVLYVLATVPAGGDFMRGRLLTPVLFAVALLALLAALDLVPDGMPAHRGVSPIARHAPRAGTLLGSLAGVFVLLLTFTPGQTNVVRRGIVNERVFYEGQWLRTYLETASAAMTDKSVIADLRRFEATCGPVTVEAGKLGAFSYLLGPDFHVIDVIGLTDRQIARMPRSTLTEEPRQGHPIRWLPVSYLGGRRDITLFRNWDEAVAKGDCGIIAAAESLSDSSQLIDPEAPGTRPLYGGVP